MACAMKEKKDAPSRPQASADSRSEWPSSSKSAMAFAMAGVALVGRPGVLVSCAGLRDAGSIYYTSTEGPKNMRYRIRRCSGNTDAWLLVCLNSSGQESQSYGSYTTSMSLDSLLANAGHLTPGPLDSVELIPEQRLVSCPFCGVMATPNCCKECSYIHDSSH